VRIINVAMNEAGRQAAVHDEKRLLQADSDGRVRRLTAMRFNHHFSSRQFRVQHTAQLGT
jgi:hypothetical protein